MNSNCLHLGMELVTALLVLLFGATLQFAEVNQVISRFDNKVVRGFLQ